MNRSFRRNFYILIMDAAAYAIFCAIWDVNTVIPLFLDQIGSPYWLIGATNSLKQLGYLVPQLIIVAQLYRVKRLSRFIRAIMLVDRPQLFFVPLFLLLLTDNTALLIIFFISFAVLCFGEGTILIPWMDLMGRSLESGTRGRFWGTIQVTGGLAAMGTGFIISRTLDNPHLPYPYNFVIIFGIGAVTLLPSVILFKMVEDPVVPAAIIPPGWVSSVLKCLDNKQFALLIAVQHLAGYDSLAIPYYIVMVRHKFPWPAPSAGTYVLLSIFGGVLGGVLWGILSGKRSNYRTIKVIAFFKVLTSAIFLTTQLVESKMALAALLGTGFVLVGVVTAAWVGFVNYILNIATHSERPFFIAISNAVLLPVAFLPILGGFIREYSGDTTLFIVTTVFTAFAFIISLQMRDRA